MQSLVLHYSVHSLLQLLVEASSVTTDAPRVAMLKNPTYAQQKHSQQVPEPSSTVDLISF